MHENDIVKSSGNVFVDLGFQLGEVAFPHCHGHFH